MCAHVAEPPTQSYFDQAIEVAKLLAIKETTRSWGGQRVPMCGFPLIHLDRHLKTLVLEKERFVAMCEEFKRPDGTFERRVVRVITPGTLIDESFINHYENNYLLAISPGNEGSAEVGMAWIDITTGEFFSHSMSIDGLVDDIIRIGPREVVLPTRLQDEPEHPIRRALVESDTTMLSYTQDPGASSKATMFETRDASSSDDLNSIPPLPRVFSPNETAAISLVNNYLSTNLLEHMPALTSPFHENIETRMQIDAHTIKALEIREGSREGGTTGSLLSVIKRTVTSSGTRLLARWLCELLYICHPALTEWTSQGSPSTSISEINARQSLVALFVLRPHFRRDLIVQLKRIEDASRIVQKFLLGKGDTDDLLAIKYTINVWSQMKKMIELEMSMKTNQGVDDNMWKNLQLVMGRFKDLEALSSAIDSAVDENALRRKDEAVEEEASSVGDQPKEVVLQGPSSKFLNSKSIVWTIKSQYVIFSCITSA